MAGDPWWREEGKVPDGRRLMAGAGGPLRLRDWLVAQIESGRYAGLRWEDAGKTLFRIPWKHAARQGYRVQQDAALFRAWAIHKGKHLEGIDKEDPPTWKTRLRCALNKSADFCEVRERSQLDSPNPYKVYRIVADGARGPVARACVPPEKKNILQSQQEPPGEVTELACGTDQDGSRSTKEDKDKEQSPRLAQQGSLPPAARLPAPLADHRYQAQDPTHHWSPLPSKDFGNPGPLPGARRPRAAALGAAPAAGRARRAPVPGPRVPAGPAPPAPRAARQAGARAHLPTARHAPLPRGIACPPSGRPPGARVPNPSVLWRGVPRAPRPARGAAHHGPQMQPWSAWADGTQLGLGSQEETKLDLELLETAIRAETRLHFSLGAQQRET
uniref:interferon regulatory factor 5-like isoform X3 n=1 Tax=Halichoerus grypus TaxID=9711 RepID=UPI001659C209|nr:interferon regulatory factor 5-like isoform X3 [Halichoerus grypus]